MDVMGLVKDLFVHEDEITKMLHIAQQRKSVLSAAFEMNLNIIQSIRKWRLKEVNPTINNIAAIRGAIVDVRNSIPRVPKVYREDYNTKIDRIEPYLKILNELVRHGNQPSPKELEDYLAAARSVQAVLLEIESIEDRIIAEEEREQAHTKKAPSVKTA